MPIKIAFISSKAYKNYISSISQNLDDIQLEFFIYEEPEDAITLLPAAQNADAIIVGGLLPFQQIQPLVPQLSVPCHYMAQDETAVATTLLSILQNEQVSLHELAIDVIDPTFVSNILDDMNYTGDLPYILSSTSQHLYKEHTQLFHEGSVKLIVTGVHQLYEKLENENIPVFRMKDSKSATLRKMEEIKSELLLQKSKANRATTGIIECSEDDFQSFIQFTKYIHAIYKKKQDGRFELYTTSGRLQQALDREDLIHVLAQFNSPYRMGFGYGESMAEALQHAQEAIHFATPGDIFLIDERTKLFGPFPSEKRSISLKLDKPQLKLMAEKTKLSSLSLSKFLQFIADRQSDQFTAQDLADYLHVTRRTAERTIKKLLDHAYLVQSSSEMTYQKGRPKAVYTFLT